MAGSKETQLPANLLPIGELISNFATSIAFSQEAMDKQSLDTAKRLLDEGLTQSTGIQARWYTIPKAEFDLKVLMQFSEKDELLMQLVNGEYSSKYSMNMEALTQFNFNIARTPTKETEAPSIQHHDDIAERVFLIRNVSQIIYHTPQSHLCIDYKPNRISPVYYGGKWIVELVRYPDEDDYKDIPEENRENIIETGLILCAYFQIDDESGEIEIVKFFKENIKSVTIEE